MKNFLKKLHIVPNQPEDSDGTNSSKGNKSTDTASPIKVLQSRHYEHKPFSGFSNWLSSVAHRKSPSPPPSDVSGGGQRMEPSESVSSTGLDVVSDALRPDSGSNTLRDPDIEEEYQIQLALELSAKEDPEAVQIEAVKQISLGSCAPENTPAEVVAYRYWNYNALTYDDKISDGFYDLYGTLTECQSKSMPSLVDLQGIPVSENVTWEAVLVNRSTDANLLKLEQKALEMAVKSRSEHTDFVLSDLVRKLAILVSDNMGGTVADPDGMLRAWQSLSYSLRASLDSMVLPLGSLTIGLARHRALMFKVLADGMGIPCRLVKGHLYTGSDDVAMNFVKIEDGREYIVDLMADPGTLIPSDAAGSHVEYDDSFFSASPLSREIDSSHVASSSSGIGGSFEEHFNVGMFDKRFRHRDRSPVRIRSDATSDPNVPVNVDHPAKSDVESIMSADDSRKFSAIEKMLMQDLPNRPNYPHSHARSPSWTEGISSPAVHRMKVKDVSQYMMDAAKENPQLAQKLQDVLLESGVVAPPNLFTEVFRKQLDVSSAEEDQINHNLTAEMKKEKDQDDLSHARFLPPLPHQRVQPKIVHPSHQFEIPKPEENLVANHPHDTRDVSRLAVSSQSEVTSGKYVKNVPVAAAAAAAAAVVASSMVVAAAKSNPDTNLELPVAAAATATAAAVVATTAAVSKQYEQNVRCDEGEDGSGHEQHGSGNRGSGGQERQDTESTLETEKISKRSAGNESSKSDITIDVAEIPWEEISLGERIGLGSYGEVYRGEWHGTEVAVKRFLDQDISGESLAEFKSEVKIMQRLRHPNVVLFMGAVTRPPNLSIVTEFLPRGSLYRLIHRPNNQLDERRRIRMALDAARGMNYLHNCSPVIVHRDLKSPNLLVDKNWVVKVCDFGLSRMKHSTFLSSRSTAGTAEWMAPEVLRNEPSDEKSDVYSFGVILWELCTLQQPWWGMNPMQVVGAVGFQHRRLDIPNDIDPAIANIIRNCWQTDPRLRPTFAEIMAALKPLQKPITSSQVPRPVASFKSGQEASQPPEVGQAG